MFDYSLIAKYFSGNIPANEKVELDLWVKEGSNKDTLEELRMLWEVSGKLRQPEAVDVDVAWVRFRNKAALHDLTNVERKKTRKRVVIAVVVMAVITGVILWARLQDGPSAPVRSANQLTAAGPHGFETVLTTDSAVRFQLPDNTGVWLNKGGKIRLYGGFNGRLRMVSLEGEAFFEVKEDALHPFYVRTRHSLTRVTGTAFNIRETMGGVEVKVMNGEVEIISAPGKKRLSSGQTGTMTGSGSVQIVNGNKCTNWWQNIPCKVKRMVKKIRGGSRKGQV
jgi:transmembrane sensor